MGGSSRRRLARSHAVHTQRSLVIAGSVLNRVPRFGTTVQVVTDGKRRSASPIRPNIIPLNHGFASCLSFSKSTAHDVEKNVVTPTLPSEQRHIVSDFADPLNVWN